MGGSGTVNLTKGLGFSRSAKSRVIMNIENVVDIWDYQFFNASVQSLCNGSFDGRKIILIRLPWGRNFLFGAKWQQYS